MNEVHLLRGVKLSWTSLEYVRVSKKLTLQEKRIKVLTRVDENVCKLITATFYFEFLCKTTGYYALNVIFLGNDTELINLTI